MENADTLLSQDDDGTFEISNMDIGAPDDSDDEEARVGTKPTNGAGAQRSLPNDGDYDPPSGPPPAGNGSQQRRDTRPRDSLDGETIFAVGDGDKFSDDEDDDKSDEESGLVKGKGK